MAAHSGLPKFGAPVSEPYVYVSCWRRGGQHRCLRRKGHDGRHVGTPDHRSFFVWAGDAAPRPMSCDVYGFVETG